MIIKHYTNNFYEVPKGGKIDKTLHIIENVTNVYVMNVDSENSTEDTRFDYFVYSEDNLERPHKKISFYVDGQPKSLRSFGNEEIYICNDEGKTIEKVNFIR